MVWFETEVDTCFCGTEGRTNVVPVVAKSGDLDCTLVKCGVVTRSDHLRYTDRTQDVFVPISFNTNP